MKKLSLILALLLLACTLSFTSCNKNLYDPDYVYDGEALVGKWREENYKDEFYKVYEFDGDGKVSYKYFVYGIENDSATETAEYYVTDKNKITTLNEKGDFFDNYFSVNSDGRLVISNGKDDVLILVKYDLTYNENADEITGEWVCTDEGIGWRLTLNGDGTGTNELTSYPAISVKYSVKEGTLYMFPDKSSLQFISTNVMSVKYNKEGNVLKLTVDDGSIRTFEKE